MTSIGRSLFDIFEAFPQYQEEFCANLDLKRKVLDQERFQLRDKAKIFVLSKEFPALNLDYGVWKECLKLNGHDIKRTHQWINDLIDTWNADITLVDLINCFFKTRVRFNEKCT